MLSSQMQLRAAARAAVCLHTFPLLAPVLAEAGGIPVSAVGGCFLFLCGLFLCGLFLLCLLRCRSLFLLLCVKCLNLRDIVAGTAVIALQLAGSAYKVQRSGAAGALIVGYLCWHRWFHLFHFLPLTAARMLRAPFTILRSGKVCPESFRIYLIVMLLRITSGAVPGAQSSFLSPMDSARPSSICATYSIQS